MDNFVPTFTPATDITALTGTVDMPDVTLINKNGLKSKHGWEKNIPIGMQQAAELTLVLDYSELTAAQQEAILQPVVDVGSDNGIDYILTNVWTLKTDRGTSGSTWYVEYQGCQRRVPVQEYLYDVANSNTPTEISITLYDIRRALLERVETDLRYPDTLFAPYFIELYADLWLHGFNNTDIYTRKQNTVGRELTARWVDFDRFHATQAGKVQTLYQYLCRDTAATVSWTDPYGVAVTLYQQTINRYFIRSASALTSGELLFCGMVYAASDIIAAATGAEEDLRLAGLLSDTDESLRADSAFLWDSYKQLTEWFLVKDHFKTTESAGTYTLTLDYKPILGLTENAGLRTLGNSDIVTESFIMQRGQGTIRSVEYVNKGVIDDERDAIELELKGSQAEQAFSVQGVFNVELELWETDSRGKTYNDTTAGNIQEVLLSTNGFNLRKLIYLNYAAAGYAPLGQMPHPTPDINVGLGSQTIGATGVLSTEWAFSLVSKGTVVKQLQTEQDRSSYGNALCRVLIHLFGNEDNRLYKQRLAFSTDTNGILPENIGDAYTLDSNWLAPFGGDSRAIATTFNVDWAERVIDAELINPYDNDISGA